MLRNVLIFAESYHTVLQPHDSTRVLNHGGEECYDRHARYPLDTNTKVSISLEYARAPAEPSDSAGMATVRRSIAFYGLVQKH